MLPLKKLVCILLCTLLVCALPQKASALTYGKTEIFLDAPPLSAKSAVLLDASTNSIICQKDAHTKRAMASTTKIMTALVAAELCELNRVVSVNEGAVGVEGSSVYLYAGERLTMYELLCAMLLESANDAAVAIAVGLCGSVKAFAEEMNRIAVDMGLRQTHFINPHGLDHPEHFTTARELAKITCRAMENGLFRLIVSTRKTSIPHAGTDLSRMLINHNKLLRLYDGCIGVKTGYTQKSGRCLVSAAERDGVTLIAVTLNAPDDWNDHSRMLDYGFSAFESVDLCTEREFRIPLALVGGAEDYVMLSNREAITRTLPMGHGEITQTVEIPQFAYAAVKSGDVLGRVVWRCDSDGDGDTEILAETELFALYDVERASIRRTFWQWLCSLFGFWS